MNIDYNDELTMITIRVSWEFRMDRTDGSASLISLVDFNVMHLFQTEPY